MKDNIVKACLSNPREAEYVRKKMNEDPEFRIAAKFMSENILFQVGDVKGIFKVHNGAVTEIQPNPTPLDTWSYFIMGPEDGWDKLLQPFPPPFYQGFFSATMREDFQFGGNVEALCAHYWATERMINIMRELQNASGGENGKV